MTDLQTLSDEDLDQLRRDTLAEQERREARDTLPGQIADMTKKFLESGGDPTKLNEALGDPADLE